MSDKWTFRQCDECDGLVIEREQPVPEFSGMDKLVSEIANYQPEPAIDTIDVPTEHLPRLIAEAQRILRERNEDAR